jgi:membrane protease YdiL (CAAX protease family)
LITALVDSLAGVILHAVILSALIVHSSMAPNKSFGKLYLALAIVPLIRIVTLAMPLAQFMPIYQYLVASIPVLIASLIAIRVLELTPSEIGLSVQKFAVQGLVVLTGIGFGLAEYYILKPEPLVSALTLSEILVPSIILLVATGFVEELAFRGIIQRCSIEALGPWGWVYTAVVFSVPQVGHHSATQWLFALLVGLLFGWVVKRTGSLVGVTLAHGITNIGLYLVFPLVLAR